MLILTEQFNGTLLIQLKEEKLMAHVAADFRTEVAEIVAAGNHHLILDLSAVRVLDSGGLACLVTIKKMVGKEGSLALCSLTERVERVFKLTRMDTVFDIFDDTELALAA